MNKLNKKSLAVVLLVIATQAVTQQYEIKKYSINSGSAKLSAGQYQIHVSIGQADAGNKLSAGTFSLNGGFWHENTDLIFKNGFE